VRRKKAEQEKAKLEAEAKRKTELESIAARFAVVPEGCTLRYFDEVTPIPPPPAPTYPQFKIGDEVVGQPAQGLFPPHRGEITGTIDRFDPTGLLGSHYHVKVSTGQLNGLHVWLSDKGLRKAKTEPPAPTRYENMSQWDKLMSFLHLR
jgi:hypothetical protein